MKESWDLNDWIAMKAPIVKANRQKSRRVATTLEFRREILSICSQALSELTRTRQQGSIHTDLKSEDITISYAGGAPIVALTVSSIPALGKIFTTLAESFYSNNGYYCDDIVGLKIIAIAAKMKHDEQPEPLAYARGLLAELQELNIHTNTTDTPTVWNKAELLQQEQDGKFDCHAGPQFYKHINSYVPIASSGKVPLAATTLQRPRLATEADCRDDLCSWVNRNWDLWAKAYQRSEHVVRLTLTRMLLRVFTLAIKEVTTLHRLGYIHGKLALNNMAIKENGGNTSLKLLDLGSIDKIQTGGVCHKINRYVPAQLPKWAISKRPQLFAATFYGAFDHWHCLTPYTDFYALANTFQELVRAIGNQLIFKTLLEGVAPIFDKMRADPKKAGLSLDKGSYSAFSQELLGLFQGLEERVFPTEKATKQPKR